MLTERQLLHVARCAVGHHKLSVTDRGFNLLPLFHINAQVATLVAPLPVDRRAYMVWSVIYTGLALITAPLRPTAALTQLGINLLTGTACYHLYFLVVTMQCYLLFPLFFRFLRASAGRRRHVVDAAESRPGVASSRDRV